MITQHVYTSSTPRYGASKRIVYPEFRAGVRLVQSVLGLAYLAMVVWSRQDSEFELTACTQLSSAPHCFMAICDSLVYRFRLAMGFLSFMAASVFAEYSEQTRQFEFGYVSGSECDMKLADHLFPAGIPESFTVMLSCLWTFNVAVSNAFPLLLTPPPMPLPFQGIHLASLFLHSHPNLVFSILHFANLLSWFLSAAICLFDILT
ncbi:hypothetical protein DSO57_1008792 [Entomophthora muscae]|uniref:Uncharacterized protein n=2 Tax=Entomophthora muscae TaxID=34485 RepID=A0ACC2U9F8_9FUNG|nr:hypothetical protein DSO57_1034669 [Entomophthora muscae]KAJ9089833.1 hypothetical protein DSO57_1008792 [Entomophthora muscae]